MSKIKKPTLQKTEESKKIINAQKPAVTKPVIGITFLGSNKKYGLENFYNCHVKHRGNRNIINELNNFILSASKFDSIQDLIDKYKPKNHSANTDDYSKSVFNLIKDQYGEEVIDRIIHIHCKAKGNGEFVLHGFTRENVFEIVMLDPEHKVHKV